MGAMLAVKMRKLAWIETKLGVLQLLDYILLHSSCNQKELREDIMLQVCAAEITMTCL